jgi:hypothetical protein
VTTVQDSLIDLLTVDFARARTELETARRLAERRDTTAHRAAVSDCQGAIDAVLDMFLLAASPTDPGRHGWAMLPLPQEHLTAAP